MGRDKKGLDSEEKDKKKNGDEKGEGKCDEKRGFSGKGLVVERGQIRNMTSRGNVDSRKKKKTNYPVIQFWESCTYKSIESHIQWGRFFAELFISQAFPKTVIIWQSLLTYSQVSNPPPAIPYNDTVDISVSHITITSPSIVIRITQITCGFPIIIGFREFTITINSGCD